MKRNLTPQIILLILLCFCRFLSYAQITITRSDFGSAGDMAIVAHDTIPTAVTPGNAGASQAWDLSAMTVDSTDTTNFMLPSATPYAADFPTANLAALNLADSSFYFVNASNSSVDAIGYATANPFTGNPLLLSLNPVLPQITFQSTMGTQFSAANSSGQAKFYYHYVIGAGPPDTTVDSVRITRTMSRNSEVDGWGTTTIPSGTFQTIRQKAIDITETQIEVFVLVGGFPITWISLPPPFSSTDTTITYYYLANGQRWPIAQLTTDWGGNMTDAQYLMNTVIGIPEYSLSRNNDVVFYPNPSHGNVNISVLNPRAAALEVYDLIGRKTETVLLSNILVSHSFDSYTNGLYSFRVVGKNGEPLSSGKFIIEK